jgi:hypothetical protein
MNDISGILLERDQKRRKNPVIGDAFVYGDPDIEETISFPDDPSGSADLDHRLASDRTENRLTAHN